MKKIAYTALVIMFAITSISSPASAQPMESRYVSGFNRIASNGPFTIHVKIDGTESLYITNKPEVIKSIETVVEDSVLKIRFKNNMENRHGDSDRPVEIYITAKSIACLENTGSGFIDVDGEVVGNTVSIVLNGAGTIQSSVKTNNLQVIMSGAGHTNLSGTADNAKVSINGSGEMNGRNLKTKNASVTIGGSANVYFSADKTVSASIAGSGSVYYSGNAIITEKNVIGAGGISKTN
jgi:hypothetical protein